MTALRTHRVEGQGGVGLHVADAGPEDAPPILFLHGWSQHHLCWRKQLEGPLAERFRLVAPDLRGHGASDKPDEREAYLATEPWGEDIAAIIRTLRLVQPLLVGWSMGGWVACDYLRHHGEGAISGLVMVGSSIGTAAAGRAERRADIAAPALHGSDQAAALDAAIRFARAMTAAPLSKADLALVVGWMMLCPPHARDAARAHGEDYRPELAALTRPAMILDGAADRLAGGAAADELAAALPEARRIAIAGAGHMPFWEQPVRFDADLSAFAMDALAAEEGT